MVRDLNTNEFIKKRNFVNQFSDVNINKLAEIREKY